jgi:hypothetical protein
MITIANADYDRAWEAIPRLPGGFAVPAAVAADVYRGIQSKVVGNGYDNITRRARTSLPAKVLLATKAWLRLRWLQVRGRLAPKPLLTLLPVLLLSTGFARPVSAATIDSEMISRLRSLYVEAGDRREAIDEAAKLLAGLTADDRAEPLIEAFDSAFEIARAKHAFWPFSKLKHVRRGLPVLDRLVEEYPDDVEIRFLRLVSCYYMPGIMGRKGSVREDFAVLIDLLPASRDVFPESWFRRMVIFELQDPDITTEQRANLEELLGEANQQVSIHGEASQ